MSPLRLRLWALVAVALATGVVIAWVARPALVHEREEDARTGLSDAAAEIAAIFESRIAFADVQLSGLGVLLKDETHGLARKHELDELCDHAFISSDAGTFQRLLVADTRGVVRCATFEIESQEPEVIREREYFQRALDTRSLQFAGPFAGAFTERPVFITARPLIANAVVVAVAAAAFDVSLLLDSDVDLPAGTSIYTVDGGGAAALLSPEAAGPEAELPPSVRELVARGQRAVGAIEVNDDVWSSSEIQGADQAVVLAAPTETLYAEARRLESAWRNGVAVMVIVTLLAGLALDVGLTRRLLRLHRLARLPRPAPVDALFRDEVDQLLGWVGGIEAQNERTAERMQAMDERQFASERELAVTMAQVVESRYHDLRDHGDRVALYARSIGRHIGLADEALDLLSLAAQVHDVGKLVVSDAVYLKPGRLDPVERGQMQLHASRGQEILDRLRAIPSSVGQAARHHHERWDGNGYPDGLRGEAIPLWARVIAVADSYDAMTEQRPYRPARSHEEAVAILKAGGGSQWDRQLVEALLAVLGEGAVEPKSAPLELLEAVEGQLAAPNPSPVLASSESPEAPTSFAGGRYVIQKLLGEGATKRVYLAHDTRLDRDVAFGLIKMDGLDEVGRERILREAQAMARMGAHPHIVTVFDLGEHNGQPYIVTELMSGEVEQLVSAAGGPLPIRRTLEIAKDVCRGLDYAHSKGVVHRDVKPNNVWLTRSGTAKVGDFGIALSLDRTRLTREATTPTGTVSYMPPEQVVGGEVTPRSDLYSLGAMLYELVTGQPPFVSDDAWAVASQQLMSEPSAPSGRADHCPPALEALILRMLEKSPDDRPESAAEVLDILETIDTEDPRTTPTETSVTPQ